MAFKKTGSTRLSVDSPESMLHDIRSKKIEGPLARQADIWREYTDKAIDKSDVAIRLPTGSGKTLVGIVLGEWRRRKYNERILYLCPTNQLVHQVAKQAREVYGIDVMEFTGSKREYPLTSQNAYRRKEKIAISSYSALFNINPYFENPDIIILDDAHSSENYIASMWSLEIDRFSEHEELFNSLIDIFEEHSPLVDLARAKQQIEGSSLGWVEKIPSHMLYELSELLRNFLDSEAKDNTLKYPWSLIRDNLQACHCYISASQILIRPLIPPTFTHAPFVDAKQRIYMSATLGNGGDLERTTGRKDIYRLAPDSISDAQGIGRRFFVVPEVAFNDDDVERVIADALDVFKKGLFITPSSQAAKERIERLEKLCEYEVYNSSEIEKSKEVFVRSEAAVAVIANRYDGIDFPHDECRLLVLEGLPKSANLQEKFLMSRMGCRALLNDRIQTRIVQAVGRCTRANSDYAAVIIKGQEWVDYLLTKDNAQYLHPEIQAELDFGEVQSVTELSEIKENLEAFKYQNELWLAANDEIVSLRAQKEQAIPEEVKHLEEVVSAEIKYATELWRGDYTAAYEQCRNVLSKLTNSQLQGYRALWNYLAGSSLSMAEMCAQVVSKNRSREYYLDAMKGTQSIGWLVSLAKTVQIDVEGETQQDPYLLNMIERIESNLLNLGIKSNRKFNDKKATITSHLSKNEAKSFENGQLELGRFLGFECDNTETRAAPDPWWILGERHCIVFEDHTEATNGILSVEKARQVYTHDNWIKENVKQLKSDAEITKILITPVTKVAPGGIEHLRDVYILSPSEFRNWGQRALAITTEIRRNLQREGDLIWRAQAATELTDKDFTPMKIVDFFTSKKASDFLKE